jgi:hypothetical protein
MGGSMIRVFRIDGFDIKEINTKPILSETEKRKIIREECAKLCVSEKGARLV